MNEVELGKSQLVMLKEDWIDWVRGMEFEEERQRTDGFRHGIYITRSRTDQDWTVNFRTLEERLSCCRSAIEGGWVMQEKVWLEE